MLIDTNNKPLNILVIRHRFIGDTILTVPFLRNLRYFYPQSTIDVLVGPNSGEVLDSCPYINRTIVFDTTRFHKYDSAKGKPRSYISYALELRKNKYDLIFILKRSFSSALLAFLCGAKERIGYDTEGRGFLLTKRVKWNERIHEVESLLSVLTAKDIPIVDKYLEAWTTKEEEERLKKLLPQLNNSDESTHKVLIHAASAHPDKEYPLELWAQTMQELSNKCNVQYYFSGAQMDIATYQRLEKLSGIEGINLAGKLSLKESMALYKKMDLALCVDSGPAHLACAVGTPTIALFGPTDPERWRPWGKNGYSLERKDLECRPCHFHKTCADKRQCLTELSPESIWKKALEILTN